MENRDVYEDDGTYIVLKIPHCEFYLPMEDFAKTDRAEDLGDTIRCFGLFNVGLFKDNKLVEMRTMNLPTSIELNVYDSEIRDVKLKNGLTKQCKVLKYIKGQKIMYSSVFKDDIYAKRYLRFILTGTVPDIVPYSKALDVWLKNQRMNDANFGVSLAHLECVLAVYNRNPNNLSEKFSVIAGDEGVSDYDYATASVRQICQYNSTFTSLTFEDFDSMATSSLNRTRRKIPETPSPVEKIIKM